MYRDNTLIPREAVRLLALGLLSSGEAPYAALASSIRHFTSHIVGPSLELVAPPLELLKVEGLIEPAGEASSPDQERLRITEAGREDLRRLLTANVRPPVSDINKLILSLKLRFLHLLPQPDREFQIENLAEMSERELIRLTELRAHQAGEPGHLTAWLDLEIDAVRGRLDWLNGLSEERS